MPFDFKKIKAKKRTIEPVDPIELFQKLKITDSNINDLWLAQGDALRKWNENRKDRDIGIVLNTGAGKTLVGLLIGQSLVNEIKGKVLYACSSIQLVEQTAEKAKGYGLNVTTYFRRNFNNDLFQKSLAPCITTYQALFNGRSIFFREEIDAVIFDDSHTAEHLLRDHFSLKISRDIFPDTFKKFFALFQDYHIRIGKASYSDIQDKSSTRSFLIPPFEIHRTHGELLRLFKNAEFNKNKDTTFAWEHLKDHTDLCCIIISGTEITITPPFIPVRLLPYFDKSVRRVYLSATLSATDAFVRTFGCVPNQLVTPKTTAGECERLIIVPSRLKVGEDEITVTKQIIQDKKTLVLVPTYHRSSHWQDFAELPPPESVSEKVTEFKVATGSEKLLLAARYDGVDLPGDTCRIMVMDDLPMGVGPLERFLWEQLKMSNTLRTSIASRIIQSFGRISRGLSDHGVVFLTGDRLIKWLLTPKNIGSLPAFLQKQISLGMQFSESAAYISDLSSAMEQCLGRDEGWLNAYSDYMQNAEHETIEEDTDNLTKIALAESGYAEFMWKRDYQSAIKCLNENLELAYEVSSSTGAWHSLWIGRSFQLEGGEETAIELYKKAHASQYTIPAFPSSGDRGAGESDPPQIVSIDRQFRVHDGKLYTPKNLNRELALLDGSGSPPQVEESLRALGQYLGLKSSRPDNEEGTGPDVLWQLEGEHCLCIEAKTGKTEGSVYNKSEIGQLLDHIQWVKENTDSENIIPIFVGPVLKVSEAANPPKEFLVMKLESMKELAERLVSALNDVAKSSMPLTLRSDLQRILSERGLLWPECFQTLEHFILRDI